MRQAPRQPDRHRPAGARNAARVPWHVPTAATAPVPVPHLAHRRSGFRDRRNRSEPPLPPLVALQVAKALAFSAVPAKVEFLDILIVRKRLGGAIQNDLPLLHDIAI